MAFESVATNLVPQDTNGQKDIFVHDLQTGTTERVSVASDGSQANNFSQSSSISADGRYVVFQSPATNLVPGTEQSYGRVFVYDRQTDTIELASVASDGSPADGFSYGGRISADGFYVAFTSNAPPTWRRRIRMGPTMPSFMIARPAQPNE